MHPLDRWKSRSHNFGRDENRHPIDNSRSQCRARQMSATFDQHTRPSPLAELDHQLVERDLAAFVRDRDHLDTSTRILFLSARQIRVGRHNDRGRGRSLPIDPHRGRRPKIRVDDHSHRISPARDSAREPRIVREHGASADHHRVAFSAPSMNQRARFSRADPLRIAALRRYSPIERHRQLKDAHRTAVKNPGDESLVEARRFIAQHVHGHANAGAFQDRDAAAFDARVGIAASDHNARDARQGERIRARRSLAEMGARFERDVGRRTTRARARLRERVRFAMRASAGRGGPASDDFAATHDYASYCGIRRGQAEHAACER